ncbi:LuxR C-terminal-related transcriptional regulator [Puerhibacterium sp. TATVAM-FAB25]|uniref:LuxR C-terminal-related transcriptional regulator n=1 Tax=Puerhibacterium sp. TATVAM-FAB25 TaxID=3093699 RepID=UPI00397E0E94
MTLVRTKLRAPRPRAAAVPRDRLVDRLADATTATLTVVVAPAGFGKTTLLAQWLARPGTGPVAWFAADPRDDDPAVFWRYVLAALATAAPDAAASARERADAAAPATEVLTTLVNDLADAPDDVVLVIDDHHAITSAEVRDGLAFLVEHAPPTLHLVLAGRTEPDLPLARLRARGRLVELRAADLRFTAAEALAFLGDVMGVPLDADAAAALHGRTEGWAAALQLAALSLRGRPDPGAAAARVGGTDRFVLDYLAAEVLDAQPAPVRDFLLRTSVLDRLEGGLCDAVTGGSDGAATLAALDRADLFLVPLDDRRTWYRYHHLFADVLRARLAAEAPGTARGLHLRASDWFAARGDSAEAVEHALAAEAWDRAADLVAAAAPALRRERREATLGRWLAALPRPVLADRPELAVAYAGTLLATGRTDEVDALLAAAERAVGGAGDGAGGGPTGGAGAGVRATLAQVALYRAAEARARGDLDGTVAHAERALHVTADDDHLARGAASGMLGLARWSAGDLDEALECWSRAHADLRRAGHRADALGAVIALADIRLAQGRLRDARRAYRDAIDAAAAHAAAGGPPLRGLADMHVGLADTLREAGDLAGAREHLRVAEGLGDDAGLPQNAHRSRVVAARLRLAEGDAVGAVALLEEAERRYVADYFPDVRPVASERARALVAAGDVDGAWAWVLGRGLDADLAEAVDAGDAEVPFLREHELVTLARVLLARHAADGDDGALRDAARLLARLERAAGAGGRGGTLLEVLVLQARAHQAAGDGEAALAALAQAVRRAAPQGVVGVFADEGEPVAALLRALARSGADRSAARHLLTRLAPGGGAAGSGREGGRGEGARGRTTAAGHPVVDALAAPLVDPLSARELEVLRLLATDLDGPGIAARLVVSLHTVRSHTKSLYAKLGAHGRREAVRRAIELGLLGPDDAR